MTFNIVTLFPQAFDSIFASSILKRAQKTKKVTIKFVNPRDFARDKYKTVDDKPYGGGAGMVMKVDTIVAALESIHPKPYAILLSASGKRYTQSIAYKLRAKPHLAIICGHYEGVDARVEKYVEEVISIGDFVLTGGEIAAAAIVDSVARLIPGVINPKSLATESFSKLSTVNSRRLASGGRASPLAGLSTLAASPLAGEPRLWRDSRLTTYLEYPQYTRPENFRGAKVPKVLLSGDHKKIAAWRQKHSRSKN